MTDQEQAFLPVGTEVSAKFKGAFCEAKIKSVNKCVKCKVTIKSTNEKLVISDDQVKGSLKAGQIVEVRKNDHDTFQSAILNKIQDLSTYTVIFNDGDEKILKRSFLRFKGERHFLECDTLNNSPLTHPEHFLNPVKNQNNATSSSSSSPISPTSSNNAAQDRASNRLMSNIDSENSFEDLNDFKIGNVVIVEKKTPKTLYLAVITKYRLQKQCVTVKSFTDGKSYVVKKTDISEYNYSKLSQTSQDEMKDIIEIVNKYIENGTKPKIFNDSSQSDDETTSSSSDEEFEQKDRFVAQLYKFMDDRDTPMNKIPTISNMDLDMYRLFKYVKRLGGYNKVTKQKNWSTVCKKMVLPTTSSSNVANLKSAYKKYLLPYEEFYRKLGSSICDSHNSVRPTESHRRLQLFKHRVSNTNIENKKKKTKEIKKDDNVNRRNSNNEVNRSESENEKEAPSTSFSAEKISNYDSDNKIQNLAPKIMSSSSNESSCDSSINKTAHAEQITSNLCQSIDEENEDLTLTSMVKNLNDDYKKRKKQEKKNKRTELKINCDKRKKSIDFESNTTTVDKKNANLITIRENKRIASTNRYNITKSSSSSSVSSKIQAYERKHKFFNSWSKRRNLCIKKKINHRIKNKLINKPEIALEKRKENTNEEAGFENKISRSKTRKSSSKEPRLIVEQEKEKTLKNNHEKNQNTNSYLSDDTIDKNSNNADSNYVHKNEHDTANANEDGGIKSVIKVEDLDKTMFLEVKYSDANSYKAKVVKTDAENQKILVHYSGWNNRYDEWIGLDRIIRIYEDAKTGNEINRKRKSSIKKFRLSDKNESERDENTEDDNTNSKKGDCKIEENPLNQHDNFTLVSIKNEIIDAEYDTKISNDNTLIQNSSNVTLDIDNIDCNLKGTKSTEEERLKINEEQKIGLNEINDTSNTVKIKDIEHTIVTRKKRTLQNLASCEPIVNKRKSDSIVTTGDPLTEQPNKHQSQKYELFKPTVKSRKDLSSQTNSNCSPIVTHEITESADTDEKMIEEKVRSLSTDNIINEKNLQDEAFSERDKNDISPIYLNVIEPGFDAILTVDGIETENQFQHKKLFDDKSCDESTKDNITDDVEQPTFRIIEDNDSKFNFNTIDKSLLGEERIKVIEEHMRECRKIYLKLKNEIVIIDKKKKKHQKKLLSKQNILSGKIDALVTQTPQVNT